MMLGVTIGQYFHFLIYPFTVYAEAGIELINKAGGEVISCGCIIELPELNGREKIGDIPLYVLVEKEDTEGGLA